MLAQTHEYRSPSPRKLAEAAAADPTGAVKADMTSRYLGLVVIPGQHMVKMEVEEFASQLKKPRRPPFGFGCGVTVERKEEVTAVDSSDDMA